MNFLFALFPGLAPYRILIELAIVAAAVAALLGWLHVHDNGVADAARNEVRAEWNAEKLAQRDMDAKETQRRLERQGDAQRENAKELARYQRAAADAADARDGYHELLDSLEALARHGSRDTATADERQAGAAAAGMLADVSRGADGLAEIYARTADESRRAGVLCERDYDALTR